jgi:hypothetical protein
MSRENAVGAWAEKAGLAGIYEETASWEQLVAEEMRISPEEAQRDLAKISMVALIGLGLLIAAGAFLATNAGFGGALTQGVVVHLDERPSRHGSVYAPVVDYRVDGAKYRLEGSMAVSWNAYDVGDKVTVSYDPADPGQATIRDFHQAYFLPCLLGAGGLLFLLGAGGLVAYVGHRAGWQFVPSKTASRGMGCEPLS